MQKVQVGDEILISKKPTGTLVHDDLLPGKNLYFLSSGTGLAPFLALIRDPETYEKYEKIILKSKILQGNLQTINKTRKIYCVKHSPKMVAPAAHQIQHFLRWPVFF